MPVGETSPPRGTSVVPKGGLQHKKDVSTSTSVKESVGKRTQPDVTDRIEVAPSSKKMSESPAKKPKLASVAKAVPRAEAGVGAPPPLDVSVVPAQRSIDEGEPAMAHRIETLKEALMERLAEEYRVSDPDTSVDAFADSLTRGWFDIIRAATITDESGVEILHPDVPDFEPISAAFENAFIKTFGTRPGPKHWEAALSEFEDQAAFVLVGRHWSDFRKLATRKRSAGGQSEAALVRRLVNNLVGLLERQFPHHFVVGEDARQTAASAINEQLFVHRELAAQDASTTQALRHKSTEDSKKHLKRTAKAIKFSFEELQHLAPSNDPGVIRLLPVSSLSDSVRADVESWDGSSNLEIHMIDATNPDREQRYEVRGVLTTGVAVLNSGCVFKRSALNEEQLAAVEQYEAGAEGLVEIEVSHVNPQGVEAHRRYYIQAVVDDEVYLIDAELYDRRGSGGTA